MEGKGSNASPKPNNGKRKKEFVINGTLTFT